MLEMYETAVAPVGSTAWMEQGRCAGESDLFFAPFAERPEARVRREARARSICDQCVVLIACRDYARRNRELGFWGGEERVGAGRSRIRAHHADSGPQARRGGARPRRHAPGPLTGHTAFASLRERARVGASPSWCKGVSPARVRCDLRAARATARPYGSGSLACPRASERWRGAVAVL